MPASSPSARPPTCRAFGPNAQLTAIIDNWADYYIERVQAVMDGTWESGAVWGGIDTGMVQFADFSDAIPEEVRAEAEAAATPSPKANSTPSPARSTARTAANGSPTARRPTDDDLHSMTFYVEGIEGTIPN
jgi:basic membrane protein A and related proteins